MGRACLGAAIRALHLVAHWVGLGYVKPEDVRDHIIQSLAFQPVVYPTS